MAESTVDVAATTSTNELNIDDLDALADLNLDFNQDIKSVCGFIENLLNKFKNEPESFECKNGISFLSMKNMLMIEYLTNLLQVIYLKMTGQKISGNPCVLRLAKLRCYLEKSKTIEVKLKYQIDKLLKIAMNTASSEHDPLSFKPSANDFEDDDEDVLRQGNENDEFDNDLKPKPKSDGLYHPPKLAATYDDTFETAENKVKMQLENMKRRARNSAIMNDLKEQYSEGPEEIRDQYANTIDMETARQKEKIAYEEENFVRKPLTKEEIQRARRLERGTNVNTLTSFSDARILLDDNINMEEFMAASKDKKRKTKSNQRDKNKPNKKQRIRYT